MNLKPLGDRVIVKRDEAETKTASGLYIASSAQEKPQTGIVLAARASAIRTATSFRFPSRKATVCCTASSAVPK